jgi:RNA polymerase sigma-70 factor (ECF subfamily)
MILKAPSAFVGSSVVRSVAEVSVLNSAPTLQGAAERKAGESPLARLFVEHNRELLSFLVARLGSEAEAHEVAQESYARLLRLDQPETLGFLRADLFKTAGNLAIDRLRHRTTLRKADPQVESLFEATDTSTPEDEVSRDQEARRVAQILDELPAACRRSFVLYRVYDYSLAEVAAEIGVSERMVRYYVVQAITHCRNRLRAPALKGIK